MVLDKRLITLVVHLFVPALFACGSGDGPGKADDAPALTLEIEPSEVWLRRGEATTVRVALAPAEALTDVAVIQVNGLPEGVSAADAVVRPGDGTEAEVSLTASNTAVTGGPYTLEVQAPTSEELLSVPVELTVAGQPGQLDEGFGEEGVAVLPRQLIPDNRLTAFAPAEEGLYGSVQTPGYGHSQLFRLTSDGLADESFGDTGITEIIISEASKSRCTMTHSHRTARVAAACVGRDEQHRSFDLLVHCFDVDGTPEEVCGDGGKFSVPFDHQTRRVGIAHQFFTDAQGRLVLVFLSYEQPTSPASLEMFRYAIDGKPDTSFGMAGHSSVEVDAVGLYRAIALVDGGYIVAGARENDGFAWRITESGQLDEAFGTNGVLQLADNRGVVEDQEGRLYFATADGEVVATDSSGRLDTAFATGGVLTLPGMRISDLATAADGELYVAGRDGVGAVVLRILEGGVIDSEFEARPPHEGGSSSRVAVGADGRIWSAIEDSTEGISSLAIVRYWP